MWLRKNGAGTFGMSTIPEVLGGYVLGMEVMAVSLITNLCAGL
jgi:purine nucleoside phosphorylase